MIVIEHVKKHQSPNGTQKVFAISHQQWQFHMHIGDVAYKVPGMKITSTSFILTPQKTQHPFKLDTAYPRTTRQPTKYEIEAMRDWWVETSEQRTPTHFLQSLLDFPNQ